jgi:aminopeptidase N
MTCCQHLLEAHAGGDFALPGTEASYAPDLGLEPTHLDIALRFHLDDRAAEGQVVTTVVARRAGERTLRLDAVDLQGVAVDSPDGQDLTSSYDGRRIVVTWAKAPAVGEARKVRVAYRVEEPLTGMFFAPAESEVRWVATDHETERARHWLPCVDHPSVRTPLDVRLRGPKEHTFLANGLQVGEDDHGDGTRTVHWKLEQPCPSYLVCVVGGDLVRAEGGKHEDVEVAFFAPKPTRPEDLARSFGTTKAMLDWMTKKLDAAFPYPKYYQAALPGIGGAMENISLVTWDDAFVADEILYGEWGRLIERVNVHEMAHSYFGDAIVIRDYAHAWLKESWATYTEALWVEDQHGRDELHYLLYLEGRDYMGESDGRYARPIVTKRYSSSWDMFDQHLYPGGAWRIHMLRQIVGEAPFWAAVHDYVQTYSGQVVETDDFRRKLEAHSGLNLDRFFDQWLRSPGYPKLKVSLDHDPEQGEAKLTVEQTQVDATAGVGLFAFDLEVAVEVADGEWLTVTIPVSDAKHAHVLPAKARPLQLVVDPDQKVLFRLECEPGTSALERALKGKSVKGRIQAAQTLAKAGSAAAIKALDSAYGDEAFWGVRAAMAEALGDSGHPDAAQVLVGWLETEAEPKALATLVAACGKHRDPSVADALVRYLERKDRPHYLARAAAYRALGAQRGEANLGTLEAGAADGSWWGWVRRGAVDGLAATRSPKARAPLQTQCAAEAGPSQVRSQAALALGSLGRFLEDGPRQEAFETLSDLTRDPSYRVRVSAARALGTLGDRAALGTLDAVTARLAAQDGPLVRRLQDRLRRGGRGAEATKLHDRVEELEGLVRKLLARIEVLESRDEGQKEKKAKKAKKGKGKKEKKGKGKKED